VVAKLNEVLVVAVSSAPAKAFFQAAGNDPWTTSPGDLGKYQAAESEKWGKVIRDAHIDPE
jgi:hypothetical protein